MCRKRWRCNLFREA